MGEALGKIKIIHDEPIPRTAAGGGFQGGGNDGEGGPTPLIIAKGQRRINLNEITAEEIRAALAHYEQNKPQ